MKKLLTLITILMSLTMFGQNIKPETYKLIYGTDTVMVLNYHKTNGINVYGLDCEYYVRKTYHKCQQKQPTFVEAYQAMVSSDEKYIKIYMYFSYLNSEGKKMMVMTTNGYDPETRERIYETYAEVVE